MSNAFTDTIFGSNTIIIDNGTHSIKAGISGDDKPRVIIPPLVAKHPKIAHYTAIGHDAIAATQKKKKDFNNNDLLTPMGFQNHLSESNNKYTLQLSSPIEKNVIHHFEDMEKIWDYILENKLKLSTELNGVIITENPTIIDDNNSLDINNNNNQQLQLVEKQREKMTEVFFESFNIPFFYVGIPQVFSLYSIGKTNGFVIDFGNSYTTGISILDGIAINLNSSSLNNSLDNKFDLLNTNFSLGIAGKELTDYLMKLLLDNKVRINTAAEKECVEIMKKRFSYVSIDFTKEMKKIQSEQLENKEFQLPDGKIVSIGKERFVSTEVLFQPKLLSFAASQSEKSHVPKGVSGSFGFLEKKFGNLGVHELTHQSIVNFEENIQEILFSNIVISGGTSLIEGLQERLLRDVKREIALKKKTNVSQTKVKVIAPKKREYSAWLGASILSSFSGFYGVEENNSGFSNSFAMSRKTYLEEGARAIHKHYNK
ncbi:hypothetical protein ABK040_014932 [Willaertia magna]